MDTAPNQFMVEFTLPNPLSEAFISRIPQQRQVVNRLLHAGKIRSYSLSLENSKLWVVFVAESEVELMEMISSLPLTDFMNVQISELTFLQSAGAFVANFSVN